MYPIFKIIYLYFAIIRKARFLTPHHDDNITHLQVKKQSMNVSVECTGRIISDTALSSWGVDYLQMNAIWKDGEQDHFKIDGLVKLHHMGSQVPGQINRIQGTSLRISYLSINRHLSVGVQEIKSQSGYSSLYLTIILNYFVGMDGSKFFCTTVCRKGKKFLHRKSVELRCKFLFH
ncbi:hypothetical protein RRG08_023603 [Elysia crispata]|uniref:Uncharacterized protein n=1 Tax=Elysia crispata TaxID=231223 RepID=A0AAE1B6X6_9GAST|nr:hypothetical protein RRG08_023603 [Elysia crispata]